MKHRFLLTGLAVAALGLAGSLVTAQASIIVVTPNTNFSNSSTTFSFGDATYTFSNDPNQRDQLSVMTGGSAQVTLFGTPPNSPAQPGGVGDMGQLLGPQSPRGFSYGGFSSSTPVPSFQYFGPYIGLKFLLNGDVHYGYADFANLNTLVSYAYNSVPGAGIVTGQVIAAVPEPSSLALFGLGLGLIGIGTSWLRRRRSNRINV